MPFTIEYPTDNFSEEKALEAIAGGGQHIIAHRIYSYETVMSFPDGRTFVRLLNGDFERCDKYPRFAEIGFELGVSIIRNDQAKTLLEGATLIVGIYPRTGPAVVSSLANAWLTIPAPGTIRLGIQPEQSDPSGLIWDFITIGLGLDTNDRNLVRRKLESHGNTALDVPKEAIYRFLKRALQHLINSRTAGRADLSNAAA